MVIDQPLEKEDEAYSTDTTINRIILWMTWECKSLKRFTAVLKIQPCSFHFAGQENCAGSRSLVQPNHMASMTKSKGSVPWAASHARRPTSIVSLTNNRDEQDHMEKGTIIKELLNQMHSCRPRGYDWETWRCIQDQHQIVFHIISTASWFTRTCSGVNKLWLLFCWV